ncbi:MAG: hypothetical protein M3O09_08565 [Acidobacteriota bacterium]|nr:hypothetical protein [Acidobacteriota bacterium]
MHYSCRSALLFLIMAGCAFAQSNPNSVATKTNDFGLYEYTSFGASHDSSGGWSSEMDSAIGYDFTRHFGLSLGIPFYLLTTTTQTSLTGTQTTSSNYGSLGDVSLRVNANKGSSILNYSTSLGGTVPTGDTSTGISTGHATVNWSNRIERSFNMVTPFAAASIGNSLTSTSNIAAHLPPWAQFQSFVAGPASICQKA